MVEGDDAALVAAALVAEFLCANGGADRDLMVAHALNIADADASTSALAAGLRRFAVLLAERRTRTLRPRARTDRPRQ